MKKVSKFFIYFSLLFLYAGILHAAEYVAFSLKVAQERIVSTPKDKDFREVHPEVFTLGGITKIRGLVYDRKNEDAILVGERDPERSILTLDDFVVALRARFIHGKWPLVSIDPAPETKKTNMQIVRFEGGIENTQFGQDLFDADYRLKKIGMGLLPSGVPGLKTYWDLGMERAKHGSGGSYKIGSRFWFYPVLPSVTVREGVVAIRGLKVGVFTEVLSAEIDGKEIEDLSTFQDQAGDMFAKQISERFENLATVHPSFSRLQGLVELVALTKAIEEMDERPDLDWWLIEYQVKQVDTREELKVLKRREEYRVPVSEGYYEGHWEVSGGVELMAIALRLKAGDVTALKGAVLKTRPSLNALRWTFLVAKWIIPTTAGMLNMEDIAQLFAHAVFLQSKKRYDAAIECYSKILQIHPQFAYAYNNRGLARRYIGDYERAIEDFDKCLQMRASDAGAYSSRANTLNFLGRYQDAIADHNKALSINPLNSIYYSNRAITYIFLKDFNAARRDIDQALDLDPRSVNALQNRAALYTKLGLYHKAINDLVKAISFYPSDSQLYYNLGVAHFDRGDLTQSIASLSHAIALDSKNVKAYFYRGAAYREVGKFQNAINDLNMVVSVNPRCIKSHLYLGQIYESIGDMKMALEHYKKYIDIIEKPESKGVVINQPTGTLYLDDSKMNLSRYKYYIKLRIKELERQLKSIR